MYVVLTLTYTTNVFLRLKIDVNLLHDLIAAGYKDHVAQTEYFTTATGFSTSVHRWIGDGVCC